jgi:hypothetical protein
MGCRWGWINVSFVGNDRAETCRTDFLQSITNPDDGTLLPPTRRGRSNSHSRQSSASSNRSPSPALSVSSQGSGYSRMSMPGSDDPSGSASVGTAFSDGLQGQGFDDVPTQTGLSKGRKRLVKPKVTSVATEVASTNRRTNSGTFVCPGECDSVTWG